MKKIILTTLATTAVALSSFAQGSIGGFQTIFSTDGITTPGVAATDPNNATTYYTGNITLELFYATTAAVNSTQIAAINALDGTAGGGAAAYNLMLADGFTAASTTTLTGSTIGSLNFSVSDGGLNPSTNPNTIGLANVATGVNAWIAIYAVGAGGAFNNYSGILAFLQNTGGNPTTTPPGTQATVVTDPTGLNLVLTAVAVPEPATMAMAALGGVSLLLLRRKK
jgi:hypothetical protein